MKSHKERRNSTIMKNIILVSSIFFLFSAGGLTLAHSGNSTVHHISDRRASILGGNSAITAENMSGGMKKYTVPTSYANYTLPHFNPWQMGKNDYGRGMPNQPILGCINGSEGFIYQNESNYLVFYQLSTHSLRVLASKWQNYIIPPVRNSNAGITYFYATRQNIYYTQFPNGTISEITSYGLIKNYIYIQIYNTANNEYANANTTLSINKAMLGKGGKGGNSWYNIYPFSVSNGTYLIEFSSSSTTNITVSNGIYIWNIYSKKFYAYNIGGLGIGDINNNNAISEYSGFQMSTTCGKITIGDYNWATNTFKLVYKTFYKGAHTDNNLPFFITQESNGTDLISFYQNILLNGSNNGKYISYYFFYNLRTNKISGLKQIASSNYVNDVETMGNQEVLTFHHLASGLQSGGYTNKSGDVYGLYFNYYNNSVLTTSIKWLQNEMNKTSNPKTNVLVAENNRSLFYTFNAASSIDMATSTIFTIYWSPLFSRGITYNSSDSYEISIYEKGLPQNYEWQVSLYSKVYPVNSSYIKLNLSPGDYLISFSATGYFNTSTFISIINKNASYTVVFKKTYTVKFTESKIPSKFAWYVNLTYGTEIMDSGPISGLSYAFQLLNGSYGYEIGVNKIYESSPPSGSFTVNGTPVPIPIVFSAVTYKATFTPSSPPSGLIWYVNLSNGMDSGPITGPYFSYSLANGSYAYTISTGNKTYEPSPRSTQFAVKGAGVPISFAFSRVTYKAILTETNLSPGTMWYVNMTNGKSFSSTTSAITLSLANGSYAYTIATTDKTFAGSPGSFTVNGNSVSKSIAFSEVEYAVTVIENGLSPGTLWNISVGGKIYSSTGSTIYFTKTNGTYLYSICNVTGYKTSNQSILLKVNGEPKSYEVNFREESAGISRIELYALFAFLGILVVLGYSMAIKYSKN